MNEHVLITGGLGFIGSHIADAYLKRGHSVTIVDSMVASVVSGQTYESKPNCVVIRESVEGYFESGATLEGVDRVIHTASHVGPAGILQYAGLLGSQIVRMAELVIAQAIAWDVPVCIFSSAEVYGRSGLLDENDDIRVPVPYNARIEYAIAKLLTETLVGNSRHRGLKGIVIRPFNVTGPRQSRVGGFVMPTFVQQALAGEDMTVFASGEQERAFLSATDLARFVLDYMDAALAGGDLVFNLGNVDNRSTVRALADRIKAATTSDSRIVYVDAKKIHGDLYEEAESFQKLPVPGAAMRVGWEPRRMLAQLVEETIDFYKNHPDGRAGDVPV